MNSLSFHNDPVRVTEAGTSAHCTLQERGLRHGEAESHAQDQRSAHGVQTQAVSSRVHASLTHCSYVSAGIPSTLVDSRRLPARGRQPCYMFSESPHFRCCCKMIFYLYLEV